MLIAIIDLCVSILGIRVVSNAGGINPHACAKAIHDVAKKSGVEDLKIAVVTGDNLIGQVKINQYFSFMLLSF